MEPEALDEEACPDSVGSSVVASSSAAASSPAPSSPSGVFGCNPAVGSAEALIRPSRGCLPFLFAPDRFGAMAHLHSFGMYVCVRCHLGLAATQPSQSHETGSTNGYLHSPGVRLCDGSSFLFRPLQPSHFLQGSSPSTVAVSGESPGPVPIEG